METKYRIRKRIHELMNEGEGRSQVDALGILVSELGDELDMEKDKRTRAVRMLIRMRDYLRGKVQ